MYQVVLYQVCNSGCAYLRLYPKDLEHDSLIIALVINTRYSYIGGRQGGVIRPAAGGSGKGSTKIRNTTKTTVKTKTVKCEQRPNAKNGRTAKCYTITR